MMERKMIRVWVFLYVKRRSPRRIKYRAQLPVYLRCGSGRSVLRLTKRIPFVCLHVKVAFYWDGVARLSIGRASLW